MKESKFVDGKIVTRFVTIEEMKGMGIVKNSTTSEHIERHVVVMTIDTCYDVNISEILIEFVNELPYAVVKHVQCGDLFYRWDDSTKKVVADNEWQKSTGQIYNEQIELDEDLQYLRDAMIRLIPSGDDQQDYATPDVMMAVGGNRYVVELLLTDHGTYKIEEVREVK